MVSEHLAWSSHDAGYFNDLLPVPYNAETLERVVAHIGQIQDRLKRRILLENPSTYVAFEDNSTMSETDFIREIARRSGCGLLLDINNVFVSATNHGWKPMQYLRDFPLEMVEEIHLAGHAEDTDDEGELLLIDAHDRPVADEVWKLYEIVISQAGAFADTDRMGQRRSRMAGAAPRGKTGRRDSRPAWPDIHARIAPCRGVRLARNRTAAFGAALLNPDLPLPEGVVGPRGKRRQNALPSTATMSRSV
jgi:hypothetical protein